MRLSDLLRHVPCVSTVVPLQTSQCRAPCCHLQPLGERPDSFPTTVYTWSLQQTILEEWRSGQRF